MMINSQMRNYRCYRLTSSLDAYGQQVTSTTQGVIKMAINLSQQNNTDNVLYSEASYIGLTQADVDDTYIIEMNGQKLKVLYVNPFGRFKQVYLSTKL